MTIMEGIHLYYNNIISSDFAPSADNLKTQTLHRAHRAPGSARLQVLERVLFSRMRILALLFSDNFCKLLKKFLKLALLFMYVAGAVLEIMPRC
jgi:hypothetical protein